MTASVKGSASTSDYLTMMYPIFISMGIAGPVLGIIWWLVDMIWTKIMS